MSTTRRLSAILAADVAGYSRLIGEDEEGTLERLRSIRTEVIDPKIAEHRGRLVKTTGDGLLVEFQSVVDALRCASEIQQTMAERTAGLPAVERIEYRIGIHQGDIVVEDGDIFGDGVNVAARLEGVAKPGGICVSGRVQEDAAGRLDLRFDDLGDLALKNIARPVRVYRVGPRVSRSSLSDCFPRAGEGNAQGARAGATKPGLGLPDKPSIAVLPFQNMSGDSDHEFFADGIAEDITTALSRLRWFFVIARNSAFTYKGRAVDVRQVGLDLGVRYVLEGSVRKAGNRLRVTAQLVEAETGNHVWAERYDRDLSDIFALQDEITERVVAAIEPELYAAEYIRSQRKPPDSLDAWECVIRALSGIGQGTQDANVEAATLCRRAIEISPAYGQAHSLLAWVLLRSPSTGGDLKSALPQALAEARAALALDERDPWAHMAHGIALWRMRHHDESERALSRALELNPNFALAHAFLGSPLAARGAHREAIARAEHALRLSPADRLVGAYALFALAFAHFAAGEYGEGTRAARDLVERQPENVMAHALLVANAAWHGDREVVAEALTAVSRLRSNFSLAWARETAPLAGHMLERFLHALREAGVPEA